MAKVRVNGSHYWLWCPACEDAVMINNSWDFNGDVEKPTFAPSLLTKRDLAGGGKTVCHSFVINGLWNYLSDCTHDKAGQSVPMVDFPDDWL